MRKYTVKLPYALTTKISKKAERIVAHGIGPWMQDPRGYFLIRVDKKQNEIEAGFCESGNVVKLVIVGKKPEEIYHSIIKEGLITKFEHAAYLGKELKKAEIALSMGFEYMQE